MRYTPLIQKISEYLEKGLVGFHTPGHQYGRILGTQTRPILEQAARADLTEVPGLDNLKNPTGCLLEAQGLAAQVFGACKTFFLVNGSTVGLQASLLALNSDGGTVILPRQSHVSLVNGLVLSGGKPVVIPAEIDQNWGLALGTKPSDLKEILHRHPEAEAIFLTQPSYQGVGQDIREIISTAKRNRIPLVVDEAHGGHLYFQDELPLSAQRFQADIVVQSTHKTMAALTQASMLHVNDPRWIKPVARALDLLQTTSPSYLLLASLDGVQAQMGEQGSDLVAKTREMSYELHSYLAKLGYRLLRDELKDPWFQDPAKLVISAAEIGRTGWEMAAILQDDYGLVAEQSDYYYVLFLINPGHTPADVAALKKALKEIMTNKRKGKGLNPFPWPGEMYKKEPPIILTPRQVYAGEKEEIPLTKAAGRIAVEPVAVYPPGIPLVWPGEAISREQLDYLDEMLKHQLPVHGISKMKTLWVSKHYG